MIGLFFYFILCYAVCGFYLTLYPPPPLNLSEAAWSVVGAFYDAQLSWLKLVFEILIAFKAES